LAPEGGQKAPKAWLLQRRNLDRRGQSADISGHGAMPAISATDCPPDGERWIGGFVGIYLSVAMILP